MIVWFRGLCDCMGVCVCECVGESECVCAMLAIALFPRIHAKNDKHIRLSFILSLFLSFADPIRDFDTFCSSSLYVINGPVCTSFSVGCMFYDSNNCRFGLQCCCWSTPLDWLDQFLFHFFLNFFHFFHFFSILSNFFKFFPIFSNFFQFLESKNTENASQRCPIVEFASIRGGHSDECRLNVYITNAVIVDFIKSNLRQCHWSSCLPLFLPL